MKHRLSLRLVGWILPLSLIAVEPDAQKPTSDLPSSIGIKGGLVVHLGCGDGRLTAALRANDSFIVHGLDADVTAARKYIQSLGLYGPVSVERWTSQQLPYADNIVNLIVAEKPDSVSLDEVMRVLVPNGVALIAGKKIVKPWPKEIDEWTHYLHGPDNNAVAHDTTVGPPGHLQWVDGPLYGRHHDRMSSVSAVVSADGRVFSIVDEGSRISILLPARWSLIARDAFSGVVLWKRAIEKWETHLWPLKSGPAQLPRRLVASGNRVYVTLSLDGPVVALDAATGQTVCTYANTKATEEIILSDGILFLLVNPTPPLPNKDLLRFAKGYNVVTYDEVPRQLTAIRAESGEVLWTIERRVLPVTLAANRDGVFFNDGERVVCLDRHSGKEQWHSPSVPRGKEIRGFYAPILVVQDDVVLFSGGERAAQQTGTWDLDREDTMTAFSARDGHQLWKAHQPPSGYRSPEDLLVVNGLVWCGNTTSGRATGKFTGRDLHTGDVKVEFDPDVDTYWFHHRCYRGKATDNYLLMSRAGTEFVDFRNQHWIPEHWVRGACLYGLMPANGLLYAPQHPCACYLEAKLAGFNALAPAETKPEHQPSTAERLERGPAYSAISNVKAQLSSFDWPTYRHDAERSGTSMTKVPVELKHTWQANLGGKLSALTVADGRLFVASVNAHTIYALDENTGCHLWGFTADGRVDSPPTIWQGRVLFGSADGYVYCLRATDGALVWRFRAALRDENVVAFGQVESLWPVPGNVLVRDGVAYFAAGRSMFLDSGLRLWRLDAATGKVLSETVLDDRESTSGKTLQSYVSWLNMPTALPDILSSDDRFVYMRSQPFKFDGSRLPLLPMPRKADADNGAVVPEQRPEYSHLFCPTGFTDDTGWHRSYWLYGSTFVSGWQGYFLAGKTAPAGRLLVFNDTTVYGFGRKPQYYRWSTPMEDQLFATDKAAPPASELPAKQDGSPTFRVKFHWTQDLPLLARAMVLAGETLFMAGPPQFLSEEQTFKHITEPAIQPDLLKQELAYEGRAGGLLRAVKATTGEKLGELRLDSPPVFDGMAAANGRLFLSTVSGQVICLGANTRN